MFPVNITPVSHYRGFTLVELVTVIVLLGIVTAVITPRFISRDSFADYAVRDQIIAAARIAQQRAMYDHSVNACYRLEIDSGVITAQSFNGSGYDNIGPTEAWVNGIAIEGASVANTRVYFDGLGSPLDGSVANCAGSTAQAEITISGPSGLAVCIYSSGYVQAQFCSP